MNDVIRDVAFVVAEAVDRGVCEDDGRPGQLDGGPGGVLPHVGQVHDHPQPVHLTNHFLQTNICFVDYFISRFNKRASDTCKAFVNFCLLSIFIVKTLS